MEGLPLKRLRTQESIPFGFLQDDRAIRSYRSAWCRMNFFVRFLTMGILVAGILIRGLRREIVYHQSLLSLYNSMPGGAFLITLPTCDPLSEPSSLDSSKPISITSPLSCPPPLHTLPSRYAYLAEDRR